MILLAKKASGAPAKATQSSTETLPCARQEEMNLTFGCHLESVPKLTFGVLPK